MENNPYPQADYLRRARDAAAAIQLTEEDRAGLKGAEIGEKIRALRLAAVTRVKKQSAGQLAS